MTTAADATLKVKLNIDANPDAVALAKQLFDVFQRTRNSFSDDYCVSFDYLDSRIKASWVSVANAIISQGS